MIVVRQRGSGKSSSAIRSNPEKSYKVDTNLGPGAEYIAVYRKTEEVDRW